MHWRHYNSFPRSFADIFSVSNFWFVIICRSELFQILSSMHHQVNSMKFSMVCFTQLELCWHLWVLFMGFSYPCKNLKFFVTGTKYLFDELWIVWWAKNIWALFSFIYLSSIHSSLQMANVMFFNFSNRFLSRIYFVQFFYFCNFLSVRVQVHITWKA